MEPVVYDFAINPHGTFADLLRRRGGPAAAGYYAMTVPRLLRADPAALTPPAAGGARPLRRGLPRPSRELAGMVETLFDRLFAAHRPGRSGPAGASPSCWSSTASTASSTSASARPCAAGRIGLAQNRLPASTTIEDVRPEDVIDAAAAAGRPGTAAARGATRWRRARSAVVTLAAGAGSRWTQGAGVVKALHPFCKLGGRHRTFLEIHLAKSRRIGHAVRRRPAHVVTTSYLTHEPDRVSSSPPGDHYGYAGPLHLRRATRSGCGWCRWCATCASPGRRCRSSCSTSRSRRCATACTPP